MPPLPLELRLKLSPWFGRETMDQAGSLIECPENISLLLYRQMATATFAGESGHVLLACEPAPQLHQGFRLAGIRCTLCKKIQKPGDHCVHAAALAALLLGWDGEQATVFGSLPLPLLFEKSIWQALGKLLAERNRPLRPDGGKEEWQAYSIGDSRIEVRDPGHPADHPQDAAAWRELVSLAASGLEQALNQRGTKSTGQQIDQHGAMCLCRRMAMRTQQPAWRFDRCPENGLFTLSAAEAAGPFFRLTPCRAETWPVARLFTNGAFCLADPPDIAGNQTADGQKTSRPERNRPAEGAALAAFSSFSLDQHHRLVIEPWLRLPDGGTRRRDEIEPWRYGRHYCLTAAVFHPVVEQKTPWLTPDTSGLPLLALVSRPETPTTTVIATGDVPSFLARHHAQIFSTDNEIAPELTDFSLSDLPETLELADFREDNDWCYIDASYRQGGGRLALPALLAMQAQGITVVPGRNGRWLQLRDTPLDWLYNNGKKRLHTEAGGRTTVRLSRQELLALTALVPRTEVTITAPASRTRLQNRLDSASSELHDADMPAHLRGYQKNGLAWLYHLRQNGVGGILADDMGLGKTHQALALAELLARQGGAPILVVCPTTVIPHWQHKIDSFYPSLSAAVYHGAGRHGVELKQCAIILTSYGILRQDIEHLAGYRFRLVILDEIQYVKNRNTATAQAAALLHTEMIIGLTGTPLENSLTDLKSLFDLCLPGLLGSDEGFRRTYLVPIEEKNHEPRKESLRRLIRPFMLRRLRGQVLEELPERIEDLRTCSLCDSQAALYRQIVDGRGRDLVTRLQQSPASRFPYMDILAVIHQLKQVCNHPALLEKSRDYRQHQSGKWDLFTELLEECLASSLKVVVFSQYVTMLDIIEQYLTDQGIGFGRLRGNLSLAARQQQVDSFNTDPGVKVFCASLMAGGVGIDLTAAQAVIHYDRWWNAAREEQATARVHRMGQRHVVQDFKLITSGTLEEKIHRMISARRQLAEDLIQADDATLIKRLGRDELAELLLWE